MITAFIAEFNKIGDSKWVIKDMPDILYYAKIYYSVHKPTAEINSNMSDIDVQKRSVIEGIYYTMGDSYWTLTQKTEMQKLAMSMFS